MSEAFEKGLKLFGEVYGEEQANGLREYVGGDSDGFGKLQAQWAMEWAFGTIWTREDQLSRKMRSCAVLGMVIGLGTYEEIKYHTKMGTANGLTKDEIQEIYYSAIPYCGLPKSNIAKAAIIAGYKELEHEAGR
ncbi:carboxymuconolactone decarboxylase family protein [Novosphingobium sp. G106]|uniref:carboxymuconolactone decarboxylase family protein n=1 Tax=Novosphingobium sp. G106 TaxID=2849500 RepID=UPI001C2D7542|nr:carboxymuconolactone decarboxylase family protein [Novosphingobium sp. G106]MBV1686775.1 carboxymuconolactone decarboxylase family protein [Novosphingobium sp. G106]